MNFTRSDVQIIYVFHIELLRKLSNSLTNYIDKLSGFDV